MEKRELEVGDVVQIAPSADERGIFGGCLMIVTAPKPWGARGVITGPRTEGQQGFAPYLCKFEDMEYVGKAAWLWRHDAPEEEEVV